MKLSSHWLTIAAALTLFGVQTTQAATISCGVHKIQDGGRNSTTKYEVLKKCGEPKFREGNSWIYSRGGREIEVYFQDGKIESIK